jgi:hypothetical protein
MATQRNRKGLLRRLSGRVLRRFRSAVFDALAAEHVRAERASALEDEKDFCDRLLDPLPHFDIGDIKYSDGRFRYF